MEWDILLEITLHLDPFLSGYESNQKYYFVSVVREILELMEGMFILHFIYFFDFNPPPPKKWIGYIVGLFKKGEFLGPEDKLIAVMTEFSKYFPEESVFEFLTKRSELAHPAHEAWLENLSQLISTFFTQETRYTIKEKVYLYCYLHLFMLKHLIF